MQDFRIIYEKKQKERNKILNEISKTKIELENMNQNQQKIDFKKIKKIADEFLKMENPDKLILEKIEFDKDKNIKIKFTFLAN